jgi:hypothetical protein
MGEIVKVKVIAVTVVCAGMFLGLTACSTEMSIEAAGKKYLETVCPVNNYGDEVTKAGNAQDLSVFKAAAAKARDASQNSAKVLGDASIVWPAGLRPLLDRVKSNNLAYTSFYNQLANSTDFSQASQVSTPATDTTASQEVRLKLNLSADTVESCKGY